MSISFADAERLHEAGFTDHEIAQFAAAATPSGADQPPINIDGDAWQAMIESRRDWVQGRLTEGWTMDEVENVINSYYERKPGRSVYDFLKREYKGKARVQYHATVRKRMAARIQRRMPGYGKRR